MKKEDQTGIQLHSAGATVQHTSPFESLVSYENKVDISQEFREQWVIPFYFQLKNKSDAWVSKMIELKPEINEDIILRNLGDFNWRTRSTGSYFAAIKKSIHLESIIGTHLLKSEVCYAGIQYAFTIASFNTKESTAFLSRYLEYYLKRPELYFDQEAVITALKYLDEINGTDMVRKHLKNWKDYQMWRHQAQISNLNNLKRITGDKEGEIEKQMEELEPVNLLIDTDSFHTSIESLNRIING